MRFLTRRRSDGIDAFRKLFDDYDLPVFPAATLQTLELIRNDEASNDQIAESLRLDARSSVRVLRLVNSAGFGLRQGVEDLSHAVQLVGRTPLESLLISIAVRDVIPQARGSSHDHARFWGAAVRRASVAKRLAGLLCPPSACQVFTAGLLQDMAIPLLVEHLGEPYTAVLERWHAGERPLDELEREAFGWDHAQLGRAMCECWELPESLARAVGGHHRRPAEEPEIPAPVLLTSFLREVDPRAGVRELIESAQRDHGLGRDSADELVEAGLRDAGDLAGLLS